MVTVLEVARQLGYMQVPDGVIIDIDEIHKYNPEELVIVTTGSQGEPMSALYRMAYSDHKKVVIGPQDLVVLSSSAIPGNEKLINRVINELYRSGADVVYESYAGVHVSGHACQEETKLLIGLVKPKFFIPIHGEFRHLKKNAIVANSMGVAKENIVVANIGSIIEVSREKIETVGTVPAGRTLVDGLGVGDVGSIVLRDRKHLSQDGLVVVVAVVDAENREIMSSPEVVSRGFVYIKENTDLLDNVRKLTESILYKAAEEKNEEWLYNAKTKLKDDLGKYIFEQTKRRPMILTVIKEI